MKKKQLYLTPESDILELRMTAPLASSINFVLDYDNGTDDVTWSGETDTTWGDL